jgi:lipoprotein-anchoring transpeptidase ErfK/SrfK
MMMTHQILAALLVAADAYAQEHQPAERRILISIPDRKLVLIEDGRLIKTYDIAVGAPASPSPAGVFTVANQIEHPTWYGPTDVVPPGKWNPLGTRWMGLSKKGYGIHGTNAPKSIGRNASHGCIRMRNADVEELFTLVKVGDTVELAAIRTDEIAWLFNAGVMYAD